MLRRPVLILLNSSVAQLILSRLTGQRIIDLPTLPKRPILLGQTSEAARSAAMFPTPMATLASKRRIRMRINHPAARPRPNRPQAGHPQTSISLLGRTHSVARIPEMPSHAAAIVGRDQERTTEAPPTYATSSSELWPLTTRRRAGTSLAATAGVASPQFCSG